MGVSGYYVCLSVLESEGIEAYVVVPLLIWCKKEL